MDGAAGKRSNRKRSYLRPGFRPSMQGISFLGQVLPSAKKITYRVAIKRIIRRKLVLGIADAVMAVDGRDIYEAKNLRVGLFTSTEGF